MRTSRILWIVGIVACWTALGVAADWRVGIARTDITPTEPVWMAGYAARNHLPEGTLHPLWAKALVVEDQRGGRAVIVTTDLIGFERASADVICARVEKQTGIPRQRVVLNSSHTHCGPEVESVATIAYDLTPEQQAAISRYTRKLEDKVASVVAEACKSLRPANLAFGEGKATFAINRRARHDKGVAIGVNPEGPVDHAVPVLVVRDESGRLLGALFGYACHNTTLSIYQYNGDYAGFAQIAFEKVHPGATAMFMIGCGGDCNPHPRGKVELAEEHGKSLAAAVDRTLAGQLHPVQGPLAVAFQRVDLPFVDPPGKEELQKRVGQGNKYQQRLTKVLLERLAQRGSLDTAYPCPVQVVRFGNDLSLIALAGEACIDYALRLRKECKNERIWIAGYSSEVFAYVPSERVLKEGGYEGGDAMVYFGWHGPFKPGVEDRVVGTVKTLMDQCRQANAR